MELKHGLILLVLSASIYIVSSFHHGAPRSTCITRFPKHGGSQQQTSASPYTIQLNPTNYIPGQDITVKLTSKSGNKKFIGFVVNAQRDTVTGDRESLVGKFSNLPTDAKGLYWWPTAANNINPDINCVTHSDANDKVSVQFTWVAPTQLVGNVIFRAAFVEDFKVFWSTGIEAKLTALTPDPNPTPFPSQVFNSFSPGLKLEAECGKTKGCMLYPDGCTGSDCRFAVSYRPNTLATGVDFEMTGISPGYIALAFSDDTSMGDDQTFTCVDADNKYSVQSGFNPSLYNQRHEITGVTGIQIQRQGDRIYCRFTRPTSMTAIKISGKPAKGTAFEFDLRKDWYLFLAYGDVYKGTTSLSEHDVLPLISTQKVNVLKPNIVGARSLPLPIRAHASLGLTGWIAFAGIGIIIARFYRQTLHHKICGIALWFQLHRALQVAATVLGFALVIIIFVYLKRWSDDATAHGIFGLIATGMAIVQIIGGLLRPHPGTPKRQIFNWIHRSCGLLGFVSAAVCVILAFQIDLLEEQLRLRGTVIIVIWLVFYVIWALILQLLQCKSDRDANKVETVTQNGVSIQDPSSSSSANKYSFIHIIWLAIGVVMVLVFLILILVYLNLT